MIYQFTKRHLALIQQSTIVFHVVSNKFTTDEEKQDALNKLNNMATNQRNPLNYSQFNEEQKRFWDNSMIAIFGFSEE
jgi:hypothetical protein